MDSAGKWNALWPIFLVLGLSTGLSLAGDSHSTAPPVVCGWRRLPWQAHRPAFRRLAESRIDLERYREGSLDEQIDQLSRWIVALYLKTDPQKAIVLSQTRGHLPRFTKAFLSSPSREAFCQQTSLSLAELLRQYGIASRQIHYQVDGVGVHQFLEYWNPETESWVVNDPYFGIYYEDVDGRRLGFTQLASLGRSGMLSEKSIVRYSNHNLVDDRSIVNMWRGEFMFGLSFPSDLIVARLPS